MNHTRSVFTYAYVSCALARRLQVPLTTVAEDTQNAFEKVNLFTFNYSSCMHHSVAVFTTSCCYYCCYNYFTLGMDWFS